MKLGPQTVSALVHLGLLAAVVFLVKSEARLPTSISAFISGESEEKPPPPPLPPPPAPVSAPSKTRGPRASGAPRPAAPTAAEPGERSAATGGPVMDLGLLEVDDSDSIPENAVVIGDAPPPARAPPPAPVAVAPPANPGCTEEATAPEPLTRTDVEYPPGMAGVAGRVLARAVVSAEGLVTAVEIVGSLDPAIDQAVKASLSQWTFRPARRCQKAVAGSWTLALRFEQTE